MTPAGCIWEGLAWMLINLQSRAVAGASGLQIIEPDHELDLFWRLMARTEKQNALICKLNLDDLPSLVDFLNSRPTTPSITITTPSPANNSSTLLALPSSGITTDSAPLSSTPALLPVAPPPSQQPSASSNPLPFQSSGDPHSSINPTPDNPLDAIDLQALITTAGDPTSLPFLCICSNDNLWYKKIPFSNGVGKQSLDDSYFPLEDSLETATFLQAYQNWLSVVDKLVDAALAKGWHCHHACMLADTTFAHHLFAWHVLDRTLHAQFTNKPFLVDPNDPTYFAMFECACNSIPHRPPTLMRIPLAPCDTPSLLTLSPACTCHTMLLIKITLAPVFPFGKTASRCSVYGVGSLATLPPLAAPPMPATLSAPFSVNGVTTALLTS
ncbi:hypothetical protein JB92DRAFT_3236378 [Gautieria morchelliformis]|nr:hypothetical protein JB92DRAFT_3236378 [Gautieria morchelliformis]